MLLPVGMAHNYGTLRNSNRTTPLPGDKSIGSLLFVGLTFFRTFFYTEHFLTNRYLINLNYQSTLVDRSHGSSIDLTKLDKDCEYCYIDEAHYSPKFAEEIAGRILLAVNG